MTREILPALRAALAEPRPAPPPSSAVQAAVLVPLFDVDDDLHLLYTTRSAALPQHAGQVAFPGGRHAPERDPSLLATALREADEEIGLRASDVDVLGALDPIRTFSSNFVITPFVARVPHPYALRLDPREVHDAFALPLRVLDDPATSVTESWTIEGRAIPVTAYRHDGRVIWGATQRITASLLDLITALAARQD
ncbi:MAG: CoA pyrophosphatase [Deltaproteobacteria bacterium]|nr:CoA pyrophosphatase [Deltaproteobacteria bacterium]